MRAFSTAAAAFCVALTALGVQAAARPLSPDLTGTWEVVQLMVGPGEVQALAENDPSYIGARLRVGPSAWTWDRRGRTAETLKDRCDSPTITRAERHAPRLLADYFNGPIALPRAGNGQAFSLACNKASAFGPRRPMPLIILPGGRIALPWYDNGLLVLRRLQARQAR